MNGARFVMSMVIVATGTALIVAIYMNKVWKEVVAKQGQAIKTQQLYIAKLEEQLYSPWVWHS